MLAAGASLALLACGGGGDTSANGRDVSADSGSGAGSDTRLDTARSAVAENTPRDTDGAASRSGGGTPRVVFLGTSLTAGLGLAPEQAYPALLQAKADSAGYAVRIVNAGLSGETSAGALRRAAWVLDQPAALVVLEVGAKTGSGGGPRFDLCQSGEAGGRGARASAAAGWCDPDGGPDHLGQRYTTRFPRPMGGRPRAVVALWPFLLESVAMPALNQADGIHPNAVGAQRVADAVWGRLEPTLMDLGIVPLAADTLPKRPRIQ